VVTKDKGLRVNERIRAAQVRLVGEDGTQVGIVSLEEALKQAQAAKLDLVEVAPQADPPVCRIMNYGRYKYEHKHRQGPKKHHVSKLKELRLRPKTERHDIEVRLRQARRFLERGDRVLVNMIFRGREMAHTDLGRRILEDFAAALEDVSKVEKPPSLENRRMGMILVHAKTGEKKSRKPAQPPATPAEGRPPQGRSGPPPGTNGPPPAPTAQEKEEG